MGIFKLTVEFGARVMHLELESYNDPEVAALIGMAEKTPSPDSHGELRGDLTIVLPESEAAVAQLSLVLFDD